MKFAQMPSAGQALHVVGVAVRQEELGAATACDITAGKRIYEQGARP